MTLRERIKQRAEAQCEMLTAERRRLGFSSPNDISDGDAKIIVRRVKEDLRKTATSMEWIYILLMVGRIVWEVIKWRRENKQTWGHIEGHA